MTNIDVLPRTYATLRFAGDRLDPADITAILQVAPKRAHRKDESFDAGPRSGRLIGRTGIWYFDTRDLASGDLADHLERIVALLYPEPGDTERVIRLRDVLNRDGAVARVSCFWYGSHGAQPPLIPEDARAALARLPAEIETDFNTD